MPDFAKEVLSINLEDEMRNSYLDYAMSVIVGRALPDVRDGLKPVHRRVLYAMSELGNDWNKAYKKSARVVGDVIGKYHPHGDSAVYDTIVRMAQPFSMRYLLVDGQGNFGSVDGDPAAAMRYTEIRLTKIAHRLMVDLAKDTVNFVPNYDEQETQPSVLPTRIPNLLTNGSSGIAVGMATNIPPHNMTEVINACIALIDNPKIDFLELMEHLPGPDFPTAGMINGARGIVEAYKTGRGRIYLRARTHIEEHPKTGRESLVVTELPYQVNKLKLVKKIAALVKEKRIDGISELRDESDKDGMRIVIDLKRGESSEVLLNNLFQHTQMQNVFGINMVALVDGQPKLLSLKEILEAFLRHRREVVTRRTLFELRKARARAHILEGQMVALTNIDEVVALIKASPNAAAAKEALISRAWKPGAVVGMLERAGSEASRPEGLEAQFGLKEEGYWLSPIQAQAILDLRLHRLTGLEQDKIIAEYSQIINNIEDLLDILQDPDRLMQVIREELQAINDEFGDERRTEIVQTQEDLSMEDLIPEEDVVVTLSRSGYAKSQPLDSYRAQRRGGRGKSATSMKDEDVIDKLFVANTHDTILCFSSLGKLYWLRVFQIPQASRNSLGRPIVNLLPLEKDERINAFLPIREFNSDEFVFMATSNATVKKTPLSDFSRQRANGIIAIKLQDDYLIDAAVTNGNHEIMLFTNAGKAIRFHERDVRSMGRTAYGVRGIRLDKGQEINALITFNEIKPKDDDDLTNEDQEAVKNEKQSHILVATENGYGKRTALEAFSQQKRGGMGVIAIQTSERNGMAIGACHVYECDEAMLISSNGTLVRTSVNEISIQSRNTQGVTLIRLTEGEKLVEIEQVENIDGNCGEIGENPENNTDSLETDTTQ